MNKLCCVAIWCAIANTTFAADNKVPVDFGIVLEVDFTEYRSGEGRGYYDMQYPRYDIDIWTGRWPHCVRHHFAAMRCDAGDLQNVERMIAAWVGSDYKVAEHDLSGGLDKSVDTFYNP